MNQLNALSNRVEYYEPALKNMYSKDGPEKFRAICENYPNNLNGAWGNIETHYPEHVETIRKVRIK
jgi:hypothetical protein